jgi:prephenate dehydrogenase
MEGRVAIIGLGCVGASIGLAIKEIEPEVEVIGHDKDRDRSQKAHSLGAVDKTHWNLPATCEGARLVILALPLSAIEETLEALAPHLEEGAVVTDTGGLKAPVLEWAAAHLPDHVRFVAGDPIPGPLAATGRPLTGLEAANADLFDGGTYCITPAKNTDPDAVELVTDLAYTLGAEPLFLDPLEHDGLRAGAAGLPALVSAALLNATIDSPGWTEMRKVASQEFIAFTSPSAYDYESRRTSAMLNKENIVRRLDMLLEEIGHLRQLLVEEDESALGEAYAQAFERRTKWLGEHAGGEWRDTEIGRADVPGIGQQISQMLFGGLMRRSRGEEE